ncbi:RHS repeat-associated core domain-containing protein [Actinacidiphila yeochonensis]|uniref:RHS repeat-associated core domain-containing protein n=1 Tax=Actinacidiphila yeochonensis TaxID=89050 RepID=UPI00068A105D|nr:RHS repeat-associated core domain-containing protein [Actinacidiphila yeochonensis]
MTLAVTAAGISPATAAPQSQQSPAQSNTAVSTTSSTDIAAPAGDLLLNGYGDSAGYHLEVGTGATGYTWREVAVVRPGDIDDSSWTGYQCVSGDGHYAGVTVLPAMAVNQVADRDHGAFAYSVDLRTGAVRPVASGVALKYHSPGCGIGDTAEFTVNPGDNEQQTQVLSVDLATAKVTASASVTGQVTSVVPTAAGPVGAMGGELVRIPVAAKGGKATPVKVADVGGVPYDLRPESGGGVDFAVERSGGSKTSLLRRERQGKVSTLGQGPASSLQLMQGRGGHASAVGATSVTKGSGVRSVSTKGLPAGAQAVSLDGAAAFGPGPKTDADAPLVLGTKKPTLLKRSAAPAAKDPVTTLPNPVSPAGTVAPVTTPKSTAQGAAPQSAGPLTPAPTAAPKAKSLVGDTAATTADTTSTATTTAATAATTTAATTATSATYRTAAATATTATATTAAATTAKVAVQPLSATVQTTPKCAVDRLAEDKQVMQPSANQVSWAIQMAEQGLLTGSAYQRPANYANLGLVAYAPNDDFSRVALSHPAGDTFDSVPRAVYEAIVAQESNYSQASWHALPGIPGGALVGDYYGAGGSISTMDYSKGDCGYGLGQVTTGMSVGDTTYSQHGQWKIAVDYQENLAAGLQILERTWNQLYAAGITVNGGDPKYLENWYLAAWAYNSGIQPTAAFGNTTGCTPSATCTGPDGTWGLGWSNNPANPDYPPTRAPYLKSSYADASHPADWPYQERIMGWMGQPILRFSEPAYSTPTYQGGKTWLQIPSPTTFCTVAGDKCDPSGSNPKMCTLSDSECWWSGSATFVSDCASTCATSPYSVGAGSSEPAVEKPHPHPPSCSLDTAHVHNEGSGAPIIVDESQSQPPLNLVGCGSSNWSQGGTFSYKYGTDSSGNPIGAIDTHQLGVGFGGHVLFTHTETGSNPNEINSGTWTPNLPKLQYYKIKLHFPSTAASATNVVYSINPGGGAAPWKIRVNQDWGSEQWVTIGTFAMENGGNVVLTNKSDVSGSGNINYADYDVAYDAVAFIPEGGSPGHPIGGPPGVKDAPKGSNPSWVNCGCVKRTAGDPVDTSTGYFGDTYTDLSTPGRGMPLDFTRSYAESVADPSGPNGSLAVNGPFGYGWTYSYNLSASTDSTTGAVTVTQEDGSQVTFNDTDGTYTPSAPRYDATLTAAGSTYTFTRTGKDVFTFDATTGRLTAETDIVGSKASPAYATKLAYDSSGHLSTVTDPGGRVYTLTWTGSHITGLKDSAGRTVTYAYSTAGDLTDVYGVGSTRSPSLKDDDHTVYTYTANHLVASVRNPVEYGSTATPTPAMSMTYDSSERVLTQTDADGRTTTFTYGPDTGANLVAGQTEITDPAGHKTIDTYADGLLTTETKGAGTADEGTWTYTYDPASLGITSIADPAGNLQTFAYDDHGNKVSSSDSRGFTTSYLYDDNDNLIQTVDPSGLQTVYNYDESGHIAAGGTGYGLLTSTVQQVDDGAVTSRTINNYYDDTAHPGDVTRTVDARGNTTGATYDAAGDKTSTTDAEGDKTLYGYDSGTGLLTSTVSPNGTAAGTTASCTPPAKGCTTYAHDAWGNTTKTTDPLGHTTLASYDADGDQVSATDGNGKKTVYGYDAADQRTSATQPDGTKSQTVYNADGTVQKTIDGANKATTYTYDGQGRKATRTDPDSHRTTWAYDPTGNLTTVTDPAGRTTTYTYDPAGNPTSISYSDAATPDVTSIEYDPAGHRSSMTDGTGTTTWTYDVFGELTGTTNGAGSTVAYGYDANGNQTSITYPNGLTVAQSFDKANRTSGLTDWNARSTSFGYDADSDWKTTTYPNGTTATTGYDNSDNPLSDTLAKGTTTLATLSYTRDGDGQIGGETPTGVPGSAQTYAYTDNEQVKSATAGSAATAYAYDAAGNPVQVGTANQVFDAAGELCWSTTSTLPASPSCASPASGGTTYGYDTEGDRTSQAAPVGSTTYTYGQDGGLTAVSGAAGATYTYNGDGLRAAKTVGSTTTAFTWDGSTDTPNLLSDGTTSYLYGPGGVPVEQIGSATQWYFHDQLGSTRALTDSTGAVSAGYAYTAYGAVSSHTGTATTPLQYTGQYTDAETGFVYLRARYYDPATAQFLTVDPDVEATLSAYAYVYGNPLNGIDPSGLWGIGSIVSSIHKHLGVINAVATAVASVAGTVTGICAETGLEMCAAVAGAVWIGATAVVWASQAWEDYDTCHNGVGEACVTNLAYSVGDVVGLPKAPAAGVKGATKLLDKILPGTGCHRLIP